MTEAWYIDSLDGLSGLAFASFRRADLRDDMPALDLPAWYVAAPNFSPEAVSSRSIALAASRAGFQYGLLLGEAEVPFPTLTALAEFVRRLYLSGGGGDGVGGVGPAAPLPPEGGEPPPEEVAPERESFDGALSGILAYLESFTARVAELGRAEGALQSEAIASPFDVALPSAAPRQDFYAHRLLLHAASILLEDLFQTMPERDDRAFVDWADAATRLIEAIQRMGLGEDAYRQWRRTSEQRGRPIDGAAWIFREGLLDYGPPYWRLGRDSFDPVDDLARWPLPRFLLRGAPDIGHLRSVKDFLLTAAGSPPLLLESSGRHDRIALVIFAAAYLENRHLALPNPYLDPPHRDAAHAVLVERGLAWLADQFPTHVYSRDLEELFIDAGRMVT